MFTEFDNSIKHLFACDHDKNPFSSRIRCLLVDYILNGIDIVLPKTSRKKNDKPKNNVKSGSSSLKNETKEGHS